MTPFDEPQWVAPEAEAVAAALAGIDVTVDTVRIQLLLRDDRFAVRLPGDRIAWFPTNALGELRLSRETRVLGLIHQHCRFLAPQTTYKAPAGWQLRREVPGNPDPVSIYHRVRADPGFAAIVGRNLGTLLADQHLSIPQHELDDWLPAKPSWPPPAASLAAGLAQATGDQALIDSAMALLARYERTEARVTRRVLTRSDFGFHNLVIEPDGQIIGAFDYDDAAFADRHHDFKYLLLDAEDETLITAAIEAYQSAGGAPINRGYARLLNAASAVAFLASRGTAAPDEKPAGRTLAEDLAWTRMALERAG
ncbi:MAG: hypothetical protein JWQ89_3889 [Devosia sp.]|uniref:phosphotransferase family protein n=1 Tax=Devosia sp. TaxID=1871048 RepID=UPI002625FF47|nr:phosphotransferase [Devosia sp.]MDB5542162.1 hypothetical protein [Devosia sp.]